tara:strand:+ start:1312 stop:2061 length:750 start_codon:yes stop_codon:yes gene_type:complete
MRIISKIEIKNNFIVKGINFEGIRKVGDPQIIAKKYYENGIDEIIFSDVVASLYNRNQLYKLVDEFSKDIFVPITLGGGIRSIEDVGKALKSGADKVFLNSSVLKNSQLIENLAKTFGSQCIVVSIEAKYNENDYFCYFNSGRDNSNIKMSEWIKEIEDKGCGEILINSVDKDGTKKGFDLLLCENIEKSATRPVIISGGFGKLTDIKDLFEVINPSAISIGSRLHYNQIQIQDIKTYIREELNIKNVR